MLIKYGIIKLKENDANDDEKNYERKIRANSVRIKEAPKKEKKACC